MMKMRGCYSVTRKSLRLAALAILLIALCFSMGCSGFDDSSIDEVDSELGEETGGHVPVH